MGFFSNWLESLDYEYEILATCTRHKSPRSTCSACVDICKLGGITLVDGKPELNPAKCTQCGKCIAACPVQAVAGIFPKREIIQDALLATPGMAPAVKELLIYYKRNIQTIICEIDDPAWAEAIEAANHILDALNEPRFTVTNKKINSTEIKISRRELLTSWIQETQSIAKQMTPAKWRFNQSHLDVSPYYPEHQFADISLNAETCTLCKTCQTLCSKQCFQIEEATFTISAQNCTACGLCQDSCPEEAIAIQEKVSLAQPLEYPIFQKTCSKCSQSYETLRESDDQCVTCVKRKGFLSF